VLLSGCVVLKSKALDVPDNFLSLSVILVGLVLVTWILNQPRTDTFMSNDIQALIKKEVSRQICL
jgi:hypothetical protein